MRKRFRFDWIEDDEDDYYEEDGSRDIEVEGPSHTAVFTGILKANGDPIIRHPIVMRTGFHPEPTKYHTPTMEDNGFGEDGGKVFGWAYEV